LRVLRVLGGRWTFTGLSDLWASLTGRVKELRERVSRGDLFFLFIRFSGPQVFFLPVFPFPVRDFVVLLVLASAIIMYLEPDQGVILPDHFLGRDTRSLSPAPSHCGFPGIFLCSGHVQA